ncbi:SDR family oxidoreductase [Gracilimonas mengyeensis]|uniref:NAD(P)H dehydrogenase (Quinone) n=1 Tax=Gracilimonas mengyeensis TaxID=1302730 RepID=A0A521AFA7_9BACT|nr:SDR family oxidoreductase [Gracilimonas mengyeensis]SMO33479.1 NAD(P)H dehydrogenase (quinone) [Gracilimonas mengyeensis]
MILITGANGNLGSLTIDHLLEKHPNQKVAGLVRSEEKGEELKEKGVEIRIGDYYKPDTLAAAMEDVDTVLLISSSSMEDRIGQHKNVIDAAREQGVNQIFYTSIVQADKLLSPMATDHFETEKLIKASGLKYTIYRNTFYTEFFPMFLGDALESGEWYMPSNGQKVNFAYRSEMAEALANGLATASEHENNIYEITSGEAHTLVEYAQILSKEADTEINYHDVSVEDFEAQLKEAGLPDDVVGLSVMSAKTFANGALDYTEDHLEQLLGREPKTTKQFIKEFTSS